MLALGAASAACASSSLQRGVEFYSQRRYIDAAQVFEHTERDLNAYDTDERAQYAVYRGATLLALGSRDAARYWLSYGARLSRALQTNERYILQESLRAVGRDADAPKVSPLLQRESQLAERTAPLRR